MMYQFDNETSVVSIGPGTYQAQVSDQWSIGPNPNGGYLASIVLRAMQEMGSHSDPVSVTCHFLRPGTGDAPALVRAELIRDGRSLTTARGSLSQDGKTRVEVKAAFGDLRATPEGPDFAEPPPSVAPPDECAERDGDQQGVDLKLASRVEMRMPPGMVIGGSGDPVTTGWIRFRDNREPDPLAAVLFTDAFAPSIFQMLGRVGWVPTIEMTIHVRRMPAPGWILGQFRTTDLSDKRLIEDGALWDSDGKLVAQIRQIGMLLT